MTGGVLNQTSLDALYAYVRGDSSEPVLLSDLRGVSRQDVQQLIAEHRSRLSSIDPARSVILESLI